MESDVNDSIIEEIVTSADDTTTALNEDHPAAPPETEINLRDELSSSSAAAASLPLQDSASPTNSSSNDSKQAKKSVIFDTVTVYHFTRSQGFGSIPKVGGTTLGMKRKHFLRRKLSVDLFEEVRRRSRREILLKIRFDKSRPKRAHDCNELHCSSVSSAASSSSTSSSSSCSISSTSNANTSDSDDESFSDFSDISDSELESDSYIFSQRIGVNLRRSLLLASGVQRIDPKEKLDCQIIRESRLRCGCSCVNQCIPELCECILYGINCLVDRDNYPCGCVSDGCRNPQGRIEFDPKKIKGHFAETLIKAGIG